MFRRLLHVLYALEFLIALIAVFTVWSQVGGQGHLDSMAWYWKAAIAFPAAFATVQLTVALATDPPRPWWRITAWILVLVFLAVGAAGITYYYHLNEPQDEDEGDPGTITPAVARMVGRLAGSGGAGGLRHSKPICGSAGLPGMSSRDL